MKAQIKFWILTALTVAAILYLVAYGAMTAASTWGDYKQYLAKQELNKPIYDFSKERYELSSLEK